MNTLPSCYRCGASPISSPSSPHGCVENGHHPQFDRSTVWLSAAQRERVTLGIGKIEVVGVLGEDETLLDEQPQAIGDAIVYAKWTCVDWDHVVIRLDGKCVGIAKVAEGERRGSWFPYQELQS